LKKLLATLIVLFWVSTSWAAPAITGISGTLTAGSSVAITGTDFGTHPLTFDWIGDNIEATTIGAVPVATNWNFITYNDHVAANDRVHSGTRSLKATVNSSGVYAAPIRYDSGSGIDPGETVYTTWWVQKSQSDSTYQWKMFRLNWENNIEDTIPEIVMFDCSWEKSFYVRPGPSESSVGTNSTSMYPNYPVNNEWNRIEVELVESNPVGAANGSVIYHRHRPGIGITTTTKTNIITTYTGVTREKRYFLWQNYYGNGGTVLNLWTDDIYVQRGTVARAELGNAATWAGCTSREIQPPSAWSTTGATITFNPGALTGTAFLYVVKSDGTYNSSGYEVSIGGSSADTVAPTIAGHSPAKSAVDVATDADISATISDGGDGVDLETITMSVEGATHCCSQMVGACPLSGTKDLTCTGNSASIAVLKPSNTFTYEQVVDVIFNASDLAGNAMSADSYSFTITADTPVTDITNPVVAITSPTVLADYVTTDSATSFAGTASDNVALASPAVAWANSQGGSGNAAGSTSWSVDVLPLTASTFDATLVTNGTFDSVTTSWTANNSTLTQGTYGSRANCLSIADDGAWSEASQTLTVENGALYYITALAYSSGTDISENGSILVDLAAARTDTWGDLTISGPGVSNTWTTIRGVVRAVGTSMTIRLHSEEASTAYFDNIVVRKVTAANVITTTATDTSANTATDTLTIVYDPPAAPEAPTTKVIIHDASGKTITFSITGVHIVESE